MFGFARSDGAPFAWAPVSALVVAAAALALSAALGCGGEGAPTPAPTPLPTYTPVPPTPEPAPAPAPPAAESEAGAAPSASHPSFADIVDRIQPWVVSITTERYVRGFFTTFTDEGAGSGFIIRPDGYIVTNEHVVRGSNDILAHLQSGEAFPATVVGADVLTDIAVIKIDADGLPFATLSDTADLRVGDWALTLGNALDLRGGPTATLGIVSGLGRTITTSYGEQYFDLIQTDATINTGNSGGPLVDVNGEVIGINQATLTAARYGFAVDAAVAAPVIESLIRDGAVNRPAMGVKGDDVTERVARAYDLPSDEGVVVTAIDRRGPAYAAGVRVGDVVTKMDDIPTPDLGEFQRLLWSYAPGQTVLVEYLRGGQTKVASVVLAPGP